MDNLPPKPPSPVKGPNKYIENENIHFTPFYILYAQRCKYHIPLIKSGIWILTNIFHTLLL